MSKKKKDSGGKADFTDAIMDIITSIPDSSELSSSNPESRATELITSASRQAAIISGGASAVPGPFGMATIIPDIVAVSHIQRQLVADIAAVYGKSHCLNKESMAFCLFKHSSAHLFRDIVVRVGQKYLLKKSSIRVFQKICTTIGIKIGQRVISRGVARWLPLLGAAAVGWYAHFDTSEVGQSAKDLFSSDVEIATDPNSSSTPDAA